MCQAAEARRLPSGHGITASIGARPPYRGGVMLPDPKSVVRRAANAGMRSAFPVRGEVHVPIETDGDAGLFGPDSVTWRVHAHPSVLVGGIRALLVQSLHPLAIAGVAQHSQYRRDPLGRLQRTAAYVAATTYGTTADADEAIARVRAV